MINTPIGLITIPMLNFALPAPILPVDIKTKRPRCFGGVYGASNDPKTIKRLFASAPGSGIAVATGAISGIDVLDIDPRNGGDNWLVNNARLLPHTLVHRTPRGGWHVIMRHSPGMGCSQTLSEFGVDIKGDGGYVVWPPTPGYSIARETSIKEWPPELLELVGTRTKAPRLTEFSLSALKETITNWPQTVPDKCPENRYARAVLRNAWIELQQMAPNSGRSSALYRKAVALGGMISKGWIGAREVAEQLYSACVLNGLVDKDGTDRVLREMFRGLSVGLERPWDLNKQISHGETDPGSGGAFGDLNSLLDSK